MKLRLASSLIQLLRDENGQTLPLAIALLMAFLSIGGLSIDAGHLYLSRAQLQNATNGAALAAAGSVWNSSTSSSSASSVAQAFLATSLNANFSTPINPDDTGTKYYSSSAGNLQAPVISTPCLNTLFGGSACTSGSAPNAIRVTTTSSVRTWFLSLLGVRTVNVSTQATASMLGPAQAWNVAIIIDATGSMSTKDANCGNLTYFQCATQGVRTLLAAVNPCKTGTTCTNADSQFRVSLFIFPAVSSSTASYLYAKSSGCSTPTWMMYPLPLTTATGTTPFTYTSKTKSGSTYPTWTATHQALYGASDADAYGYVSNYFDPSTSNYLNASSSLVKAVSGCVKPITGVSSGTGVLKGASKSGYGITYYANSVYAAQASLLAEQALHPGSKNAIIMLTDGQANLYSADANLPPTASWSVDAAKGLVYTGDTVGNYPSYKNQCQQAIKASQTVTAAGTRVYSVAYGSGNSGCGTGSTPVDTTAVVTGQNAAFTPSTLTPCITMENFASTLDYFYSDWNQSGSGSTCQDASHNTVSLQDIFLAIAGTFTNPRLLPNSAN